MERAMKAKHLVENAACPGASTEPLDLANGASVTEGLGGMRF